MTLKRLAARLSGAVPSGLPAAIAALGNWRHLEPWPQRLQAAGGEDLMRVARTYLVAAQRGVARLERRTEAGR